jgi:hypothetical protein
VSENTAEPAADDPLAAQRSLDAFVANRRGLDSEPSPDMAETDPSIKYGVRWTPGPGRDAIVVPSRCAVTADHQARRMRALQRVFGNKDDATAVYQVAGEPWMILLPTYADKLLQELQDWLQDQPDGEPPAFP